MKMRLLKPLAIAALSIAMLTSNQALAVTTCQSVTAKLCPNKNARCLVRDNPDFYKDTDPALYKRLTECSPTKNKR
jgi:hypothetical protein